METSSPRGRVVDVGRLGARTSPRAGQLVPADASPGSSTRDLMPLMVSGSPAMLAIFEHIDRWAPYPDSILLRGAEGVGKTMIARYIHERSGRKGAFASESAAGVQGSLLKAELFGFAKHSFTGANETREGLIETANGGTFFLDELGDTDAELQGLLIQFMDQRAIRRIGERRFRPMNVRFIAATNADLEERIAQRKFRSDLLARFGKLVVWIPSLSERRDEIVPLARHFMAQISREFQLPQPLVFAPRVERILRHAPWDKNVRELQSTCRYAAIEVGRTAQLIEERHLPPDVLASVPLRPRAEDDEALAAACRAALARSGGDKKAAAKALGISRTTLYAVLRRTSE